MHTFDVGRYIQIHAGLTLDPKIRYVGIQYVYRYIQKKKKKKVTALGCTSNDVYISFYTWHIHLHSFYIQLFFYTFFSLDCVRV